MRLSTICLIGILLAVMLVVNIEPAAAFTGENFLHGFWELINNLLDLLFFQVGETTADSSNRNSDLKSNQSTGDWTTGEVAGLTELEKRMLKLINQTRSKNNLSPLKVDFRLVRIARAKSRDMVQEGYFAHQSPNYGSPFEMMKKLGIDYYIAGENIAGAPKVKLAQQELMKSKSHRANILHSGFTHIGIGIVNGGSYGRIYTQEYASFKQ